MGGRIPPRTIRWEGGEAGNAPVRVVEGKDLDDAGESDRAAARV